MLEEVQIEIHEQVQDGEGGQPVGGPLVKGRIGRDVDPGHLAYLSLPWCEHMEDQICGLLRCQHHVFGILVPAVLRRLEPCPPSLGDRVGIEPHMDLVPVHLGYALARVLTRYVVGHELAGLNGLDRGLGDPGHGIPPHVEIDAVGGLGVVEPGPVQIVVELGPVRLSPDAPAAGGYAVNVALGIPYDDLELSVQVDICDHGGGYAYGHSDIIDPENVLGRPVARIAYALVYAVGGIPVKAEYLAGIRGYDYLEVVVVVDVQYRRGRHAPPSGVEGPEK